MTLKRKSLTVTFGALAVAVMALGQQGNGHISCCEPSVVKAGQSFKFSYAVTESNGTGTADFRCTVTDPKDVMHRARKTPEWHTGVDGNLTIAVFLYPSEFFDGASTAKPGLYQMDCVWYVEGRGDVARATSTLNVE